MKAIRFSRHGKPDVLAVEDVADPSPGEGEALVRVEAASINPSDVKNVQGLMEQTTLPRTPGRDFAGVVEAGPAAGSVRRSGAPAAIPGLRVTARMPTASWCRLTVCGASRSGWISNRRPRLA